MKLRLLPKGFMSDVRQLHPTIFLIVLASTTEAFLFFLFPYLDTLTAFQVASSEGIQISDFISHLEIVLPSILMVAPISLFYVSILLTVPYLLIRSFRFGWIWAILINFTLVSLGWQIWYRSIHLIGDLSISHPVLPAIVLSSILALTLIAMTILSYISIGFMHNFSYNKKLFRVTLAFLAFNCLFLLYEILKYEGIEVAKAAILILYSGINLILLLSPDCIHGLKIKNKSFKGIVYLSAIILAGFGFNNIIFGDKSSADKFIARVKSNQEVSDIRGKLSKEVHKAAVATNYNFFAEKVKAVKVNQDPFIATFEDLPIRISRIKEDRVLLQFDSVAYTGGTMSLIRDYPIDKYSKERVIGRVIECSTSTIPKKYIPMLREFTCESTLIGKN